MKACVLYSGGKDSSLIAVILKNLGYEVELVTLNFGVYPSWKAAALSASNLGFKHRILKAEPDVLKSAVDIIINDGFPNNGIIRYINMHWNLQLMIIYWLQMEQGVMTGFQNLISTKLEVLKIEKVLNTLILEDLVINP